MITSIVECWMKLLIHSQTASGSTLEVWKWMRNFISDFTEYMLRRVGCLVTPVDIDALWGNVLRNE